MKNDKKNTALLAIAVLALLLVVGGAAYAYFQAQSGAGASTNINATTATTDSLKFEDGKTLSITANQENFAEGAGNESDTTMVSAKLIANNNTNSATYYYNVYLDILANNLEYTTETKTAELIMQVTNPKNQVVTSISGLDYVTVGGVSGFDITEATDLITIASNYEIKAEAAIPTAEKTDEWTIKLIFVNLETNQNANMGKTFSAKVLIQQEERKGSNRTFAEKIISTYGKDSTLLLHNSSLTNSANDGSYRYTGANPNNYVCFGSTATPCPEDNLYRIIGVFGDQVKLIKTTSIGEERRAVNAWADTSLNTEILNGTYLNGLGSTWSNKIATTTWYVGGMTYQNGTTTNAKAAYDYELGVNANKESTYNAKIGLMYVSEYYYGASSEYWTYPGFAGYDGDETTDYRAASENNWLSAGIDEWVISHSTNFGSYSTYAGGGFPKFAINNTGYAHWLYGNNNSLNARPTFYLNSNVITESGTGASTDPYRLEYEEITFTIKEYNSDTIETYSAGADMTWQEWAASDYNTSGKYVASPHEYFSNSVGWYTGGLYRIKYEDNYVKPSDKIIKNTQYNVDYLAGNHIPDV